MKLKYSGKIINFIEDKGFTIIAQKKYSTKVKLSFLFSS